MTLREKIHATVYPGDQSGYVAECQEFAIVTQGQTLDEVKQNLGEAVSLYLEDEDLSQLQIVAHSPLVVTFELAPQDAAEMPTQKAKCSLVKFFRSSPLCEVADELDLSRDKSLILDRVHL